MDVEVNLVGVAAATVAAMVVGSIWYHESVFGKEWMKLAKVDKKKAQKEGPKAMLAMLVLAVFAAYALAWFTFATSVVLQEDSYMAAAVQTSLMVWVGFILYAAAGAIFEQRPQRLVMINLGNSLVTFLAMGLALGAVGL